MVVKSEEDLSEMITRLEQQELDCQTGSGSVPVPVYCELLACYLAMDPPNLTQAKFLMQRVPASVKQSEEGTELVKLWGVGKALWTRDNPAVYKALAGPWSPGIEPIMDKLVHSFRGRQKNLVGEAYSTIKLSDMALYVGLSEGEAGTLAEGAGWGWDKASGMVTPKQGRENKGVIPPTEEQLNRLTDFISYLEN